MKGESGYIRLRLTMATDTTPEWAFLTNHARALICIARDPGMRLVDIGRHLGITERAAHRIVAELDAAGYISRQRNGRRNHYTINSHLPLPDTIAREQSIGELLELLTVTQDSPRRAGRAATTG
jgi:DNA-binding IclR family transcriptional regulator